MQLKAKSSARADFSGSTPAFVGVKAYAEALFLAARLPSATTIASVVSRRNNRVCARNE